MKGLLLVAKKGKAAPLDAGEPADEMPDDEAEADRKTAAEALLEAIKDDDAEGVARALALFVDS